MRHITEHRELRAWHQTTRPAGRPICRRASPPAEVPTRAARRTGDRGPPARHTTDSLHSTFGGRIWRKQTYLYESLFPLSRKCKPLLCVITGVLREKRKEVRALLCFLFSGTEVHVIRFGRDSSLNVTLCLVVSTLVFACNFYVVPCGGLADDRNGLQRQRGLNLKKS